MMVHTTLNSSIVSFASSSFVHLHVFVIEHIILSKKYKFDLHLLCLHNIVYYMVCFCVWYVVEAGVCAQLALSDIEVNTVT